MMIRTFILFIFTALVMIAPLAAQEMQQNPAVAPAAASAPESAPGAEPAPFVLQGPKPVSSNKFIAFFQKIWIDLTSPYDPDPSGTMVAPFASAPAQTSVAATPAELPVNRIALDQPHRSAADLAAWLQQAMAETLSFTSEGYDDHLKMLGKGFSPAAIGEFNAWVTGTGILTALQTNGLQLNGFVSDAPFLLNEGVVGGRYRWLYEVPVMVSFVPRGATSYKGQTGSDTRRLIVTLQLGRVAESALAESIMIETWAVQDNTRKN